VAGRSWPGFKEDNMSISLSTDHFLLDDQGLTITRFGYEISWLIESVSTDKGHEFYGKLIIERLSDGSSWNWTKKHGRWTVMGNGDIVDGWVRG
jgi:hypothetical protein